MHVLHVILEGLLVYCMYRLQLCTLKLVTFKYSTQYTYTVHTTI